MSRRTAPSAYDLISIPWLRLTLGADDPLTDVGWVRRDAGVAEAARVLRPGGQLVAFPWRADVRGRRRALRSPGLATFRLVHAHRGLQNLRLDYRSVG